MILDIWTNNLSKNYFLNQQIEQKWVYPYEYMSNSGNVKQQLLSTERFYSSLTGKNITDKKN